MPLLHIDTHIDLFYPYVSPSGRDFVYVTYLSQISINGSIFPVSIALRADNPDTKPLPAGTVAHVAGSLSLFGNSLLVTASEIIPLYVASTPQTRAGISKLYEPFVTAVGIVSSGRVHDLHSPAALVVDVTVERQDRWPHVPTTIRCFFNRDERRFNTLIPMVQGTPLVLSGVLLGMEDGKLAIDVHEVRCNNNGSPPEHPLAVYPNPFQHRRMMDGYVVFDGSAPPPPYNVDEIASSSSSDEMYDPTSPVGSSPDSTACSGSTAPGGKLLAKRAVADRVVSPGPRPAKVARVSSLRDSAA